MNLLQDYTQEREAVEKAGSKFRRVFTENQIRMLMAKNEGLAGRYLLDYLIKASITSANPALGEIHLMSYFSKALGHKVGVTVWSYQWLIRKASMEKDYKGFEVECSTKAFPRMRSQGKKNGIMEGKVEDYDTLVATCKVYREGRKETVYEALWTECYREGRQGKKNIWDERPDLMLKKTAIAGALRWAYPEVFSGVYIEEEVGSENDAIEMVASSQMNEINAAKIAKEQKDKEDALINREKISEVVGAIKYLTGAIAGGYDKTDKIAFMQDKLRVQQFDQLYKKPLDEVKEIHKSLVLLHNKKEITQKSEVKKPPVQGAPPKFRLGESHD